MSRLYVLDAKTAIRALLRRSKRFAGRLASQKDRAVHWLRRPRLAGGQVTPVNLPMPIIVGSPRSGTTLLRLMLDAHPDLAIPPETGFLILGKNPAETGGDPIQTFLDAVTHFPPEAPVWPDFLLSAREFEAELRKLRPFSATEGYRLFYRLYAARFGKLRWGDKTPMYGRHLKHLEDLLPEARFIHLIRDGRDVAVSLREQWFSPGRTMEVQARFWREHVLETRRQGALCRNYLEVRFEDLVENAEAVLRRICTFCELPWHEGMLHHHDRASQRLMEHGPRMRADGSTIVSREVRQRQQAASHKPPDPERIGIWKTRLSAEECLQFEAIAGDLLSELGYAVRQPPDRNEAELFEAT